MTSAATSLHPQPHFECINGSENPLRLAMESRSSRPRLEEIKATYERIFHSSLTLSKVRDAAIAGRLLRPSDESAVVPGRSIAWKLFLTPSEPLKSPTDIDVSAFIDSTRSGRQRFVDLLLEHLRAPDGSYEERLVIPGRESLTKTPRKSDNLDRNNPLSLHDENPWKEWFAAMELRKTILQDVERTFPDVDYFRDGEVQYQLTNILFVYSVTHPDIGYRQGMHELLAPLYFAVDQDSISEEDALAVGSSELMEICSPTWVAADAWSLFSFVMEGVGRWYEWREPLSSTVTTSGADQNGSTSQTQAELKPYVAPIVVACNDIQSNFLKSVDPDLWKCLQTSGIEPQIYGIRWLRLLFTREFSMQDAMVLWDGLFACDASLDLAQWVCVAMLIRIRNQLLSADYNEQLMYLLRYPPPPNGPELPPFSHDSRSPRHHHATLLLKQALMLQLSPSPASTASAVLENRNLLGIPIVADLPPSPRPEARGQTRPPGRTRSGSHSNQYTGVNSNNTGPRRGHGHVRGQSSQQLGLPEIIAHAKGFMDRGEALGINKTLMQAYTDIRRNLPDIATSLVRPPSANATSFSAFPLADERPVEERPAWEARTRFEVEREVNDARTLQRRLGASVGWIVDALLLDEDGDQTGDQEDVQLRAEKVKEKKREALETLAYVRDVLNGNVTDVEEERLMSEEELVRRRTKVRAQQEREENEASQSASTAVERLPLSSPVAPTSPPPQASQHHSFNQPRPRGPQTRAPQEFFTPTSPPTKPKFQHKMPSFARSPSPPSDGTTPVLAPNTSVDATPLTSWSSSTTRSHFSGAASGEPKQVTRPRPPARASTYDPVRSLSPTSRIAPSRPPPSDAEERLPKPRGVQHDPLGALG